jgi:hypothetical protein
VAGDRVLHEVVKGVLDGSAALEHPFVAGRQRQVAVQQTIDRPPGDAETAVDSDTGRGRSSRSMAR